MPGSFKKHCSKYATVRACKQSSTNSTNKIELRPNLKLIKALRKWEACPY